ncbi:MAG: hypothetical protein ABIQ31_06920 [Ferruginibacter sp.]
MKFSSPAAIIIFFLCFVIAGSSCKTKNSNEIPDAVYYFPEKNIYYDSLRANYYYSLDGAKTWDSMSFSGAGYGKILGRKISIPRTESNVWANNESDRKDFSGMNLNVINNQTILLARTDSISKLKPVVAVKPQPKVVEQEEEPKRGLRKFFNKLFGKKKKPAEEKNQ